MTSATHVASANVHDCMNFIFGFAPHRLTETIGEWTVA